MPTNIIITRTKSQRAAFERFMATAQAPSLDANIKTPEITEDIVVPTPKKRGRPSKIKINT